MKDLKECCTCRVHFPQLECRTDATHVLRCTLGTAVRILNWLLAASAGFSALCLAAGISRSALVCRVLEVCILIQRALLALCAKLVRMLPHFLQELEQLSRTCIPVIKGRAYKKSLL